jgi:hypothetical protein
MAATWNRGSNGVELAANFEQRGARPLIAFDWFLGRRRLSHPLSEPDGQEPIPGYHQTVERPLSTRRLLIRYDSRG